VHALSENVSAPALPFGPHLATHVDPVGQAVAQPKNATSVQLLRNGPGARHEPPWQVCVPMQVAHAAPPVPHEVSVVPARQVLPLQQPLHEVVSQTHVPDEQRWPVLHEPLMHVPPQPSLAPHALPTQLGVHPVHRPLSHVPLPSHFAQIAPPLPQALGDVPGVHTTPSQQPPHDVVSHTHAPPAHRCPSPQLPFVQTPPQPSDAPHALPAHDGVHVPVPHTFGPPPPHVFPVGQPPQSRTSWQCPTSVPHLPAQSAALSGTQLGPSGIPPPSCWVVGPPSGGEPPLASTTDPSGSPGMST
jgi:hypothetical protein